MSDHIHTRWTRNAFYERNAITTSLPYPLRCSITPSDPITPGCVNKHHPSRLPCSSNRPIEGFQRTSRSMENSDPLSRWGHRSVIILACPGSREPSRRPAGTVTLNFRASSFGRKYTVFARPTNRYDPVFFLWDRRQTRKKKILASIAPSNNFTQLVNVATGGDTHTHDYNKRSILPPTAIETVQHQVLNFTVVL